MLNYEVQEKQSFFVPPDSPPMKLVDFLRRSGISMTLRRKIKHHGIIEIDGVVSSWDVIVYPNSHIHAYWNIASSIVPEDLPLKIVYEDETLLIIDKPAGMLVHPTPNQPSGTLANAVMNHYLRHGAIRAFHPVQRLDRNTSGLLAIAKLSSVHHTLSRQHLLRRYLAIVEGKPAVPRASINLPIARDPDSIILRRIDSSGQHAITHYQVLHAFKTASLLELELQTGRTHQIRLHLSHLGHPLLGDDLYGGKTDLINRQALHSAFLELTHPVSGTVLRFSSPLPPDLQQLLICLDVT